MIATTALLFVGIFLTDLTPFPLGQTLRVALFGPPSANERGTRTAWRAFHSGAYLEAAQTAQLVIEQFGGAARREQADLVARKVELPPIGEVGSSMARAIFSHGVLNDVAACYWIRGSAYELMEKLPEARAAFTADTVLSHGRAWDPQWWPIRGWSPFGWFWSPARDAAERLIAISEREKATVRF